MKVVCDFAWEQSDKVVLWPQQHYGEMLVRATLPTPFRPRTDHLQMSPTIKVPENNRPLRPLGQDSVHTKNRMASSRPREPFFGLAATSMKTHKHDRAEYNPLLIIIHQLKWAFNPGSLGNCRGRSTVFTQTLPSLAGHVESKRSAMVCIVLTPWIDHGPKPDPQPDPKPKPTQPKPIPSV
jgi:hypothetical protein